MKRLPLVCVVLLMIANVATADHIGIYSDATGTSCQLAPGLSSTAAIIHEFSSGATSGATSSRFKVVLPVGSTLFSFNTPFVSVGNLSNDLSLGYGQCFVSPIVIGTLVVNLTSGVVSVLPATGQQFIHVCACGPESIASGGNGYVGTTGPCCLDCTNATEQATWGRVKALYR